VDVVELSGGDEARERAWDRFVDLAPDGTPFHRIAWKHVVEDVFGHAPHYLAVADGGGIRAVLPLFDVRGLRTGRVLLSVPHATYGGVCGGDRDAGMHLVGAARRLGERLSARYVELRQLFEPLPDLPTTRPFVTFVKRLDPDPDATFASLPAKRRTMIRKGERHGLEARRGWEALDAFYAAYAINLRRLGAPPFPPEFFAAIRDRFRATAELLTVWRHERLVGGVVSLVHGERVLPCWAAALPEARMLAASDFMYWELMRAACRSGLRVFDFGQSHAGSGGYDFKQLWGFAPEPIAHQYVLLRDREPPRYEPTRANPFVQLWKALPLPVTTWLGPRLIRWLPLH
jgi:FemAB-related protein (PEP-CTERM system-associated)